MMIPVVAIVGRPNVGKSTLFNRLVGGRRAIVQDDPGVTRDRHYRIAEIEGRRLQLVDTGGLVLDARDGIDALVRRQSELAVEEADVVLLVLDARDGLSAADEQVARVLRRAGKPVLHVANKVDGPRQELACGEFYATGAARVFPISAEHGLGFDELIDALLELLPGPEPRPAPAAGGEELRVALVGRPNAGKSSLLNQLCGQLRAIVSRRPGTTRDPVDALVEQDGRRFVIVDTAGLRRRRTKNTAMEHYAMVRAMRSIDSADVACLLIDGDAGVAEQDAKIANMALDAGRGLVLALNKIDLLDSERRRELREQLDQRLHFVDFAPRVMVSALTGKGTARLLATAARVHRCCAARVPTSALNRFLERATGAHPHPAHRGRPVRFFYITQPESTPPTFVVSTSAVKGVHATYRRYLVNRLREEFGFEGTPIRMVMRQRERRNLRRGRRRR